MPLPLAGLLGRITSQTASQSLGFGVGVALGGALGPEATDLAQTAWELHPVKAPDAVLVAEGVAQGQVDPSRAADWAKQHGYSAEAFQALVNIANVGPALGMAFAARRRGTLSPAQLRTAFRRQGLEEQWYEAIADLVNERLDLGAIATAVHRGIMAGAGLLIREPPLGAGMVPHVEQSGLDAVAEAQAHGVDAERLRILVGNTGLPPGLIEMLRLLNMGHVTDDDVRRAVAQSNLRNEYMDVVLELRRRLLTPNQYAEARLRGWIDDAAMLEGAGLSGMEPDDTRLLAKLLGRPLSFRQAFIGIRRGGHYDGPTDGIDPTFLHSLRQSNVRPEWYQLAWAQRFSYPSAFVLRQLTADGELSADDAERILLFEGWEPDLAHKVAVRWAAGGGAGSKEATRAELADEFQGGYITETEYRAALGQLGYTGHALDLEVHLGDARRVKSYRDKAVDAVAKAYVAFKIDDVRAQSELAELNVPADAQQLLLGVWGKQRLFAIRELTPAQIKRAFIRNLIDRGAALEALEWEHLTPTDAAIFLDE